MGVFQNNLMGAAAAAASAGGAGFYTHQIANSVRMIMADGSRLRYTPSGAGDRQTWSISMWVKRAKLGDEQFLYEAGTSGGSDTRLRLIFTDDDEIRITNSLANLVTSTAVFRDTSAWYHIMWKNTGGTNTVHVNGVQATTVSISGDTAINSTVAHGLGCRSTSDDTTTSFDGYIAEFVLFDGTAYSYTDVTDSKNGVLIPVDPSDLTLSGTNTAWLKFESSGDMGNDSSGNNNDYTASNIAASDQTLDSPTFGSEGSANFATLNPLASNPDVILTEGNLFATKETGAHYENASATMNLKGKYYVEVCAKELMTDPGQAVGLVNVKEDLIPNGTGRLNATGVSYLNNGTLETAGSAASFGTSWTAGDIVQMAVDMTDIDSVKVWFGLNNTWQNSGDPSAGSGIAATITNGEQIMAVSAGYSGTGELICNFGQEGTFAGQKTAGGNADANGYGNFLYAPPTNFLALCAANLPTADAVDPAQTDDDYPQKLFSPTLYTGSGGTQTISGVGFQPDFTWIKNRGATGDNVLMDSTRGAYATNDYYYIRLNTTIAQDHTTDFHSLESDGFIVGGTGSYFNASGNTFASWNWRANGGTTATNDTGSFDTTVQVDPSSAFSIVTWASYPGASTFGHGLGAAPEFITSKLLGSGGSGVGTPVYNKTIGATKAVYLNTTAAAASNTIWNNTEPTSTVFSMSAGFAGSGSGLSYCFRSVEGYCKVGSYEGSGTVNGAFVYTGFRPAWIMTKSVDSTSDWQVFDNKRIGYNVDNNELQANDSAAEATTDMLDIVSNGFKMRITTDPNVAETYIYLAMAHNPFQYATAR